MGRTSIGIVSGIILFVGAGVGFLYKPWESKNLAPKKRNVVPPKKENLPMKRGSSSKKKVVESAIKKVNALKVKVAKLTTTNEPKKSDASAKKAHVGNALKQYSYILRSRSIHLVHLDGKVAKKTISLKELLKHGRKAFKEDKELHLRVQGDTKAKWIRHLKQALDRKSFPYSTTNEF